MRFRLVPVDDVFFELFSSSARNVLAVAALLEIASVDEIMPELEEQADVLVDMAEHNVELIDRLEKMKGVDAYLQAIDRLESDGDEINRRVMARLYSGELSPLDVVESIVLKHA